jgi:hypothetical protein
MLTVETIGRIRREHFLTHLQERAAGIVNCLVDWLVKVLRSDEGIDPVKGVIVDEDGSEQGLLGLDAVRHLAHGRFNRRLVRVNVQG